MESTRIVANEMDLPFASALQSTEEIRTRKVANQNVLSITIVHAHKPVSEPNAKIRAVELVVWELSVRFLIIFQSVLVPIRLVATRSRIVSKFLKVRLPKKSKFFHF